VPYTRDAWVNNDATKIGYEISFTRHFYKPQPLRTLAQISAASWLSRRKPRDCWTGC
jgi:type I restriction enzyme M protein